MTTPRGQHRQKVGQGRTFAAAADALQMERAQDFQIFQRDDAQRAGLQFQGDNQARDNGDTHAGGDQIHLVGVWSREESAKLAPAEEAWPTSLPRQCHLYLDAHTYWPQRVEWWGPTVAKGGDRLQVQMEFRNPVFNRPLTADVCAQLFAFQPGDASVKDETASVTAEMTKRAGELALQRSTR